MPIVAPASIKIRLYLLEKPIEWKLVINLQRLQRMLKSLLVRETN